MTNSSPVLLLLSSMNYLVTTNSQSTSPLEFQPNAEVPSSSQSSTGAVPLSGVLFEANCEEESYYKRNDLWFASDAGSAIVTRDCYVPSLTGGSDRVDETKFYSLINGVFEPVTALDRSKGPVDMEGNLAVGKFHSQDQRSGINDIFVYGKDSSGNWIEEQQIVIEDISNLAFSVVRDVAIAGNILIVTISLVSNSNGSFQGVYIYRRNDSMTWELEQKLVPEDFGFHSHEFGSVMDFDGNVLAFVGSKNDNYYDMGVLVENSPRTILFHEYDEATKSWIQSADALALDGTDCEKIVLTEDGGLLCSTPPEDSVDVLYFKRSGSNSGYVLQQNITVPQEYSSYSHYRKGFALDGDTMAVGMATEQLAFSEVNLFRRVNDVWVEAGTIESPLAGSKFGYKMALSGNNLLVGSMYNVYYYILPASESAEVNEVSGETSSSTGPNPSSATNPTTAATTDDGRSESQTQTSIPAAPALDDGAGGKTTTTEPTGKNDNDSVSNLNPNADLNVDTNEDSSPNSDPIIQNLDNESDTASVTRSQSVMVLGSMSLFMIWLCV
ncbi:hypothetical protein ACHAXS_008163 [Conticribra weissflogii]